MKDSTFGLTDAHQTHGIFHRVLLRKFRLIWFFWWGAEAENWRMSCLLWTGSGHRTFVEVFLLPYHRQRERMIGLLLRQTRDQKFLELSGVENGESGGCSEQRTREQAVR